MTEDWIPKTSLGKQVKEGKIKEIDDILEEGIKITEPEITDTLLPNLEIDLILIGQAKGKFGGGKRRAFKQTQKKTAEGSHVKFTTVAVVGNKNGYVGLGVGSSGETVPAREKAIANSKKNIIKIKRGCGSWECACATPHSIPFEISGRESSVRIVLKPAPKGVGLAIHDECKKIMTLAGIKDVWSKTFGQTDTRLNLVRACFKALKKLSQTKIRSSYYKKSGLTDGEINE